MGQRARWAVVSLAFAAGCGPLIDDPLPLPAPGPACAINADCVPDGCCGNGTGAVHISLAPDCSAARCSGACDPTQVRCGCGVPVCKDSRCTVALSFDAECG